MPTAMKEAIKQLETLALQLSPEEQERAAQQLKELAEDLKREHEWDALLATPESQAFLAELSAGVDEAIARGDVEEGGWTR